MRGYLKYFLVLVLLTVQTCFVGAFENPLIYKTPTPPPKPKPTAHPTPSPTPKPQKVVTLSPHINVFMSQGVTFKFPVDFTIDALGNVYVLDEMLCKIFVFDSSGKLIGQFGESGSLPEQFIRPQCLSVDRAGVVYIGDSGDGSIKLFSSGRFISRISGKRNDTTLFGSISDIAVSSNGMIFVVDKNAQKVAVVDYEGNLLRQWGGAGNTTGQFNSPTSIYIDAQDTVYICDTFNNRVQVFDIYGKYLFAIGIKEQSDKQNILHTPIDCALDKHKNIFVSDGNGSIFIFDEVGNTNFIYQWKSETGKNIITPSHIALSPDNGLYLIDSKAKQILKIE